MYGDTGAPPAELVDEAKEACRLQLPWAETALERCPAALLSRPAGPTTRRRCAGQGWDPARSQGLREDGSAPPRLLRQENLRLTAAQWCGAAASHPCDCHLDEVCECIAAGEIIEQLVVYHLRPRPESC